MYFDVHRTKVTSSNMYPPNVVSRANADSAQYNARRYNARRGVLPQRPLAAVACMSRRVMALYMASSERKVINVYRE